MDIYLDESGCTGFKFDYPYLNGGSSRFLILGYCAIPNGENSNLLRITRKVFSNNKVNFKERELKGNSLKGNKAIQACKVIKKHVSACDIQIGYIAIKKENASETFVKRSNLIYNYAVKIALADLISAQNNVNLIVDKRSMKVASKFSLKDYIKTEVNLERQADVDIVYEAADSQKYEGLQLADWIANFVWRRFENEEKDPYNIIYNCINRNHLFMPIK